MLHRANNRVVTASVVSVGLALAASLYPIPGDSSLLDLFPPKGDSTQSQPSADPFGVELVDHDTGEHLSASDFQAALGHLLAGDPAMAATVADLPAETLSDFVATYGMPTLMLALNTLVGSQPLMTGGAHGAWGGPPLGSGQNVLPALLMLLDFLDGELSALFAPGSPTLVTMVWHAVLRSLDLLVAAEAAPVVATADAAPETSSEPAALLAPVSTVSDPPPEPPPTYQAEIRSGSEFNAIDVGETYSLPTSFANTTPAPVNELNTEGEGTPQNEVVTEVDPVEVVEVVEEPIDPGPAVDNTPTGVPDPPQETSGNEPADDPPDDNPPERGSPEGNTTE